MHHGHVLNVVERRALEQILLAQHSLDVFIAGFGEGHLPLLFVQLEVTVRLQQLLQLFLAVALA